MNFRSIFPIMAILMVVLIAGCKEDEFEEVITECPVVVSTNPANLDVDVALDHIITATFNKAMDPTTITPASFTLHEGTTAVSGTVTYDALTASFRPAVSLKPFVSYTGRIKTSARDFAKSSIQEEYVWTFVTIPEVTLSSDPYEGGSTNGEGTFPQGSLVTVSATPFDGYTFVNWTSTGGAIVSSDSSWQFIMAGNRDLVAHFTTLYVVRLTASPVEGGSTLGWGKYNAGDQVTAAATANEGFTFVNWTEEGTVVSTDANYQFEVNSSRTLLANFSTDTYSLNVTTVNGTVTKTPNQTNYNSGSTVLLTATPNAGFAFTSWSGDATGNSNPLTVTMNGNKNITATFTAIPPTMYTLNVSGTNGTVVASPNLANYISGASVVLTATPAAGYEFDSWSGDASGSVNPLTLNMNANKNVTANFTAIASSEYTLNVTASNGTVEKNPDLTSYTNGSSVILTATPDIGYTFTSWGGDATGSVNPLTVNMNANKNITANFTADIPTGSGPAPVALGSAGDFAILAGTGISNTGVSTMINGDVGSFPTATIVGLLGSNVNGTLYTVADPIVGTAKTALTTAFNDAQSRSTDAITLPGQLGGLTLAPGLYVNGSSSGISGTGANGILTLDAGGDANAVWIFKMASTFITDSGTSIVLAGNANPANIFWSVGTSATLGSNSIFFGNILAASAITLTSGATLTGRALAQNGAVSLDSNTVTMP